MLLIGWIRRVLGGGNAPGGKLRARDHTGLRYNDAQQADGIWRMAHMNKRTPFLAYRFATPDAARQAILGLSYIHEAADSGELITSEVVEFGCYAVGGGQGEVALVGRMMSRAMWDKAKNKLAQAGGDLLKENNAPSPAAPLPDVHARDASASRVTFLRERVQDGFTYREHQADRAADAIAFLKQNPVTRPQVYLVVETPEGNFGRDITGIYLE